MNGVSHVLTFQAYRLQYLLNIVLCATILSNFNNLFWLPHVTMDIIEFIDVQ